MAYAIIIGILEYYFIFFQNYKPTQENGIFMANNLYSNILCKDVKIKLILNIHGGQ